MTTADDLVAALGAAFLSLLDAPAVARAVAEMLGPHLGADADDRWMDSQAAAAYLGLSRNALHKLTANRMIPFSQDRPGAKCWFRRSHLDAYRGA